MCKLLFNIVKQFRVLKCFLKSIWFGKIDILKNCIVVKFMSYDYYVFVLLKMLSFEYYFKVLLKSQCALY